MGKPSIIINGSLLALTEAAPRIRKFVPPPGCALTALTCKPAAFPARAWLIVETVPTGASSILTEATAPVRSFFFIVP